ncbi:MAG: hypothetical protein JRG97_04430 [Deltaproteobacteria bacterium]|nr:hypothetical protein [Deltaproteobacteria bacterium]MBW2051090.1 hypothetical protein [Deltaproteobacteria bacterium]MBW2140305.1 hypothetical protein [Deltaproteobacteria bacterium]MBW2322904.1 hypothetical protein [Deltaproteobacteria bacterium]
MARFSLGLDLSPQSLTAILLEIDTGKKIFTRSIDYYNDERLRGIGIRDDFIIPPRTAGEADQPPSLFLKALDAMFSDLHNEGLALADVLVINNSSQQHGHVYLNSASRVLFSSLKRKPKDKASNLTDMIKGTFAYGTAPIWTASTPLQATPYAPLKPS